MVQQAAGRLREALAAAEAALGEWTALIQFHYAAQALVVAVESALELDDATRAEELLAKAAELPLFQRRPLLDAQQARLTAKLAARRGEDLAGESYAKAAADFRQLEMPFWLGVTLLEQAASMIDGGRTAEAASGLAEASEIFARLRAQPWLERTVQLRGEPLAAERELAG